MADRLATLLEDQSIVDPVEEYKGTHILVVVACTEFCQGVGTLMGWKKGKCRPLPNFNIHNGVWHPPSANLLVVVKLFFYIFIRFYNLFLCAFELYIDCLLKDVFYFKLKLYKEYFLITQLYFRLIATIVISLKNCLANLFWSGENPGKADEKIWKDDLSSHFDLGSSKIWQLKFFY